MRIRDDVATIGTYAALTRALVARLPAVPELPTGAGDVLFVVGPGSRPCAPPGRWRPACASIRNRSSGPLAATLPALAPRRAG